MEDDRQHQPPSPTNYRIVYEYDFFDEKRVGPSRVHFLPLLQNPLKEVAFLEVKSDEDSSPAMSDVNISTGENPSPHAEVVRRPPQLDPPVLLFEKKLEASDAKQSQNQLLITGERALNAFLTEEEREKVGSVNQKESVFKVITVDPSGVEYTMHLRNRPKMAAIALNREWFKLVKNNGLKKGDTVYGWGYRLRATNQFRLALTFTRSAQPQ